MKAERTLTAEKITELAKERFQEERRIDHLEGWFLAKETMRWCDSEFRDEPDAIRIAKTLTITCLPEPRMTHLHAPTH